MHDVKVRDVIHGNIHDGLDNEKKYLVTLVLIKNYRRLETTKHCHTGWSPIPELI